MKTAYLGLGSNLGDRLGYLRGAVQELAGQDGIEVTAISGVYRSDPVGYTEQPEFLNAVVAVRTVISPREILKIALRIEDHYGRVRGRRWGPRTLDIDLLLVEGVVVDKPDLVVPHPRLGERRFVLEPLVEIAPDAVLPDGTTVRGLLDKQEDEQAVSRLGGFWDDA